VIDDRRVLALIPARGGSKRLPRKNVLPLNGKPLIAWTIDAALNSKYIDKVVVSTDDEEIFKASEMHGAEVPFLRPDNLASDTATSNDVIIHAIKTLDYKPDIVIVLQPTSPLRMARHIDESLELLMSKSAEGVISVTPCEHSPLWANTLPKNGNMYNFLASGSNKRSQDLDRFYRLNGAIYCYRIDSLIKNNGITYNENTYSYIMESRSSIDIDNSLDFQFAAYILENKIDS